MCSRGTHCVSVESRGEMRRARERATRVGRGGDTDVLPVPKPLAFERVRNEHREPRVKQAKAGG
jgi:hypothetical protein